MPETENKNPKNPSNEDGDFPELTIISSPPNYQTFYGLGINYKIGNGR